MEESVKNIKIGIVNTFQTIEVSLPGVLPEV